MYMFDVQITPNFRLSEFIKSDTADNDVAIKCQQYLLDFDVLMNVFDLAVKLQMVRDYLGMAIYVNSGYRCQKLNDAVKGSKSSAHLKGLAVDITCLDNDALFDAIKRTVDYDQIICYGNPIRFIHLGFSQGKVRKQVFYRP